jgi:hypothetical protein
MTDDQLAQALAAYAAGLDAETALLERLHALSTAQRDASARNDLPTLNAVADERDRLLANLVRLEHDLKPTRQSIAQHRGRAASLPQFASVSARHHAAAELVAAIMAFDEQTLAALRQAESARRFAAQAIEAGEHTLAAYRRVVTPALSSASLLDRRG